MSDHDRGQSALSRAAIFLIDLYRNTVSPFRLPSCRFTPTCSQYAVEALAEYGLLRGGWLAGKRLLKCGPWHAGGWDPIPECTGQSQTELCNDDRWAPPAERAEGMSRV